MCLRVGERDRRDYFNRLNVERRRMVPAGKRRACIVCIVFRMRRRRGRSDGEGSRNRKTEETFWIRKRREGRAAKE